MIELKCAEQFRELSSAQKQRRGKLISNSLLPGKTVREALSKGKLFYKELPQGFALYDSEGTDAPFYTLYYFVEPDAEMTGFAADRQVLLEEPDSDGRRADYLSGLEIRLARAGFSKTAENVLVEIAASAIAENEERYSALSEQYRANGYRIAVDPDGELLAQAFALWRAHLKPTDLPQGHFAAGTDAAHIVCLLDGNGAVCGVNRWEFRGDVCEIRHTVTRPDCLRQGIGSFLILYALKDAAKNGMRSAFTYIDEQNVRSLAMYEKIGFQRTGKTCRQYVLPAEKTI